MLHHTPGWQARSAQARVLIVGGGPVGLALAIELGHRRIPCLLVDRGERGSLAPRAKIVHVRTREHLRRWGIAGALREASPLGIDHPASVVFVTRLAGAELTRFENAMHCAPGRNPLYSEHAQWIPQHTFEDVLREHAMSLPGVELRLGWELQRIEQDGQRVRSRLRDLKDGRTVTLDTDYAVGADGAHSTVRGAIGAQLRGSDGLSRNFNIVFRAPGLAQAHRHGPAIMYWQVNGELPSLIGPMDRRDTWFFMPTQVGEGPRLADLDAAAMIRASTGIDLPCEVLHADEWVASTLLSDRHRDRRIFLAGDACHLHPPFGGYGMNMGVGDGVDLGWKLAAVLQGWGGPALLDSYEAERRPVHELVLAEASANHAVLGHQLWREGLEGQGVRAEALRREVGAHIQAAKFREFCSLGVVLGTQVRASPVILDEERPAPPADFVDDVPSSRPGRLAPHAWLHDGSSLYDHFGPGFTLIVTQEAREEAVEQARAQALAAGVPLTVLRPAEPGIESLYPLRFTLVRPDQFVAWRGNAWPSLATALFERVSGRTRGGLSKRAA